MAIDDLTGDLKKMTGKGPAELKLSTAERDKRLKLITDFRNHLTATHDFVATFSLNKLGNVGTLGSAIQTKNNFLVDTANFQTKISAYLDYLEQLEATVNKATTGLILNG